MAATKTASEDEAGEGAKGGGRGKMMIIGGVVLALAGGGGFYFFKSKAAATKQDTKRVAVFLDLPDITVNLAQSPGQDRQNYLKLKVSLELADQKAMPEIQSLMPRLLDNFQVFLRELKASDLEGSAGVYRLKEELTRRTNAAVHPARVEAILFKDLLVQ